MRTTFHIVVMVFLMIISSESSSGQMIKITDLFSTPLQMNPAFAGSNKSLRFTYAGLYRELNFIDRMIGRNEKFDFDSYYLSLDYGFKSSGFAVQYAYRIPYYDNYTGSFLVSYSHELKVNEDLVFSPAWSIGYKYFREVTVIIPLDSSTQVTLTDPDGVKGRWMNAGISLLARSGNLTAGFSLDNINSPEYREDYHIIKGYPKLLLHANYDLKLLKNLQFIPSAYYSNLYYDDRINIVVPALFCRIYYFDLGVARLLTRKAVVPFTTYTFGVYYKWAKLQYSFVKFGDDNYSHYHQFTLSGSLKELKY